MILDDVLSKVINNDLTTYEILIDERPLTDDLRLLNFDISYEINRIPTAKFKFFDGDPASGKFESSSKDIFQPGKKLKLELGYKNKNKHVFSGEITRLQVEGDQGRCPYAILEAKDESFHMTLTRNSNHFKAEPEKSILESVLKKYASISSTKKKTIVDLKSPEEKDPDFKKNITQYQITDWDFLVSRAEKIGALVFFHHDGTLEIKKPQLSDPTIELAFGDTIYAFDMELDARKQYVTAEATSWDSKNQKKITVTVTINEGPDLGNTKPKDLSKSHGQLLKLEHSGEVSKQELESWARSRLIRSRYAIIKGTAKSDGRLDINLGQAIELKGIGEKFNGKQAYVSGIRHQLEKGSWKTIYQFGLSEQPYNEQFDIQPPASSGMNPNINGLQIGTVKKIEGDENHRIFVNLPIVDGSGSNGIWARQATLDAGDGRGTFFRPEINDEVIVGFINNDPNEAIILGMLHSAKHNPPVLIEAANDEKGFVSKSKLQLVFNDADKSILISTPEGNQIAIDEKKKWIKISDQNDNSVVLEPGGISITSLKNINIKTTGGDISIEANNINIKSKLNTTISASAQALIEGKGQAALKGGMVMIN